MTEIERILDQLKRAYEGDAWHGPSVREALAGVTAAAVVFGIMVRISAPDHRPQRLRDTESE